MQPPPATPGGKLGAFEFQNSNWLVEVNKSLWRSLCAAYIPGLFGTYTPNQLPLASKWHGSSLGRASASSSWGAGFKPRRCRVAGAFFFNEVYTPYHPTIQDFKTLIKVDVQRLHKCPGDNTVIQP